MALRPRIHNSGFYTLCAIKDKVGHVEGSEHHTLTCIECLYSYKSRTAYPIRYLQEHIGVNRSVPYGSLHHRTSYIMDTKEMSISVVKFRHYLHHRRHLEKHVGNICTICTYTPPAKKYRQSLTLTPKYVIRTRDRRS
jgi:hypothetical protein